ncbi:MAG: tripartite tricarboxylate transporter substrate binding protein [Alcaligenaceae bacterium]
MKKISKLLSCVVSLACFVAGHAFAAYPDKPIRLIVGSAPGGAPDVLMRTLGAQMSKQMGVPIVIENKPGASYVISTMDLVRSAPDGYTLAYGNVVSLATNISLLSKVPYSVEKDLTLIANALRVVNLMVVNNDLPVNSVQDLIAYAQRNPGKVVFGSDGNGTTSHLGMEYFRSLAQIDLLHVPYKSAPAMLTDLMGGSVHVALSNTPVSGPHVQGGRMRGIGITDNKRSATFPSIPTVAEQGLAGYEVVAWGGLIGPANLPGEIVKRLNAEVLLALQNPELIEKFKSFGAEISASSPEEFLELSRRETAKWAEVIKRSGAKID